MLTLLKVRRRKKISEGRRTLVLYFAIWGTSFLPYTRSFLLPSLRSMGPKINKRIGQREGVYVVPHLPSTIAS